MAYIHAMLTTTHLAAAPAAQPLRPYQATARDSVAEALTAASSVVLQLPTGAGKTQTATSLIPDTGVVWFLCHRREIMRQASAALTAAGIEHAIAGSGRRPKPEVRVQVCSIGAMARRLAQYPAPAQIIMDECHHVAARTWSSIIEAFPNAKVIGLTATPQRMDGQGLNDWFDDIVVGPSISSLIADGHLSPYRLFAPSQPDLDAVPIRRGDYASEPADEVMRDPRIVGDAVATYQRLTPGKRALAFTTSIATSKALVAAFLAAGVPAAHVDGSTPVKLRDAAVADLVAGRTLVLANFGVFTEGFDVPAIDAVILLRPTRSLALYLQMCGRALRTAPGKSVAFIMDHAGLVFEHGFPDAAIEWSLAGRGKRRGEPTKRKPVLMSCPECGRAHKPAVACPSCGHVYPAEVVKQAMDGELEEQTERELAAAEELTEQETAARVVEEAMQTFVPAAAFGRIIGKTPATVARYVAEGLPVNEAGEVCASVGLAWYAARPKRKRVAAPAKIEAAPKRRNWFMWW